MAGGDPTEFWAEADFLLARSLAFNLASLLEAAGFDIEQFDVCSADPLMLPSEVLLLLLAKSDSFRFVVDIAFPLIAL
jgi:hypothetical protein